MSKIQYCLPSPVGPLYLIANEDGLVAVSRRRHNIDTIDSPDPEKPVEKLLNRAAEQLAEYFDGKRKKFDVPLRCEGTEFQTRVWRELSGIPYGKTVSYGEVARRINNPRAVRAVGGANGRNPFCIIVPCHRVISSDGKLGGYSGGLEMKKRLLDLERKNGRDE